MAREIDITGLRPSRVLQALYNGTVSVGLGRLHDLGRELTELEAIAVLARSQRGSSWVLDYVHGKPLKITIVDRATGPARHSANMVLLRSEQYDRDAPGGPGSCERVIAALRKDPTAAVEALPCVDDPVLSTVQRAPVDPRPMTDEEREALEEFQRMKRCQAKK